MDADRSINKAGLLAGGGPWFHGWNVLAAGFTSLAFGVGLTSGCFAVFVLPLETSLHAKRYEIQLAVSALFYGMVVLAPLVPLLIRRTSIRFCLLTGITALSAGLMLLSLAQSAMHVVVVYALLMAGGTTFAGMIPCSALAVNWFARRRGRAVGMATMGASVGGFVSPLAVGYLVTWLGWRDACQVLSLMTLVLLVPAIVLVVADKPEQRGLFPDGDGAPAAPVAALNTASAALPLAQILQNPTFWLAAIGMGLGSMAYKGFLMNLVPLAVGRGIEQQQAFQLISVLTLFLIPVKPIIGAASEKIRASTMMALVMLLSATGFLLVAVSQELWALIVGAVMVGFGSGGHAPLIGIIIGANFPRAVFSRVMGWVMPVVYLLTAPGAVIAGFAYDTYGSYLAALLGFAAALLLVMAAVLLGRKWLDPRPIVQ
jgi:MFS family permease